MKARALILLFVAAAVLVARTDRVRADQNVTGAADLLFDQGKRSFDAFKYDEAIPSFDRVVAALTAGSQIQRPELLAQAYELRGRAKFATGDSTGAESDFSALLAVKPDYQLGAGV